MMKGAAMEIFTRSKKQMTLAQKHKKIFEIRFELMWAKWASFEK